MRWLLILYRGVFALFFGYFLAMAVSCKGTSYEERVLQKNQTQLLELNRTKLTGVKLFAVTSKIATNYITLNKEQEAILFLNQVMQERPDDIYGAYYLLMIATAYMRIGSTAISEYYFDDILQNYADLNVKGQSVHYICLQNLIKISSSPQNRIKYFKTLIERFSQDVYSTQLHLRLAIEYEKLNEWEEAIKEYTIFLQQPDSASIQIADEPNAYKRARQLVGYTKSSRDWTFGTLEELQKTVTTAIRKYDWRTLDKCKAKVNFFSMSWKQDEVDPNAQEEFSMRSFMRGNRISFEDTFDKDSNSFEAYLRTWGWSQYVNVWYFYFRKVNYPIDPDINGNWEWAGIYMGEKL